MKLSGPTQVGSAGEYRRKVMEPVGVLPPDRTAVSPSGVASNVPDAGFGVVVRVGLPFGMHVMLPTSETWVALVATAFAVLFIAAHWAALVTALTTAVKV